MTPAQTEVLDRALDALDAIADALKELVKLVEQEVGDAED